MHQNVPRCVKPHKNRKIIQKTPFLRYFEAFNLLFFPQKTNFRPIGQQLYTTFLRKTFFFIFSSAPDNLCTVDVFLLLTYFFGGADRLFGVRVRKRLKKNLEKKLLNQGRIQNVFDHRAILTEFELKIFDVYLTDLCDLKG